MSFSLITVQHPTSDTSKPQVLLLDPLSGKRVLFGSVVEGSQRVGSERSTRLSKLTRVFLTGTLSWKSLAGLPGMILTVADQGCKSLNVHHGDSKILHVAFATWRYFVFRFGMKIQLNDGADKNGDFFKFRTVNVTKPETLESGLSVFEFKFLKKLVSQIFPLGGQPLEEEAIVKQQLPKASRSNVSTNYIVKMNPLKRKFVPELVKQYRLQKDHFQALQNGEAVEIDGESITLADVTMPERKFDNVLFVDISEPDLVEPTLSVNWAAEAADLDPENTRFSIVYHFIEPSAIADPLSDPRYLRFIESFGTECRHIISHEKYCKNTLNFESASVVSLKLRSLDVASTPLPYFSNEAAPTGLPNVIPLASGQSFKVLPFGEVASETAWPLSSDMSVEQYWKSLYDQHVLPLQVQPEERVLNGDNSSSQDPVEITVLGTGSALPNKYRNVISTMLRIDNNGEYTRVILDAGENTLGTLRRMYTAPELCQVMKELKVVYLSHLHADHLLGMYSIIQEWYKNRAWDQELLLVCPDRFESFVREWNQIEPEPVDLSKIRFLDCGRLLSNRGSDGCAELLQQFGIAGASTCLANHCDRAYCGVFEFQKGDSTFKVAYSGDTRPIEKFVALGKGADLLIHEATLQDSLYQDAIKKKHSTISESLQVARLMECRKVVLTHFSQRYSKLPELETVNKDPSTDTALKESRFCQTKSKHSPVVFFAFDNLRVGYGDLDRQMVQFQGLGFDQIQHLFESDDDEPNKRQKTLG